MILCLELANNLKKLIGEIVEEEEGESYFSDRRYEAQKLLFSLTRKQREELGYLSDLFSELTKAAQNRITEILIFKAKDMIDFFDKNKELEILLGKRPKSKNLAEYLKVTEGAVSQYPKDKKELMMLGLWVKKTQTSNF